MSTLTLAYKVHTYSSGTPGRAICNARTHHYLLAVKGITPDKEIVSYCQGGGRAAHGVLALKLLGYGRVRNFDGSYGAYAASTAPVER